MTARGQGQAPPNQCVWNSVDWRSLLIPHRIMTMPTVTLYQCKTRQMMSVVFVYLTCVAWLPTVCPETDGKENLFVFFPPHVFNLVSSVAFKKQKELIKHRHLSCPGQDFSHRWKNKQMIASAQAKGGHPSHQGQWPESPKFSWTACTPGRHCCSYIHCIENAHVAWPRWQLAHLTIVLIVFFFLNGSFNKFYPLMHYLTKCHLSAFLI